MYEKYAELRDLKEITDYRVASDTGITKSTFTDWKTGRSKPKVDKLKILADYFGVSVEYFIKQGGSCMDFWQYHGITDEEKELFQFLYRRRIIYRCVIGILIIIIIALLLTR